MLSQELPPMVRVTSLKNLSLPRKRVIITTEEANGWRLGCLVIRSPEEFQQVIVRKQI